MPSTTLPGSPRLSPLQQFAALPVEERESLTQTLSQEAKAALAWQWRNWQARPNQLPPEG